MKKTKMFLLLIAMLFAITASCGGGGGGGDGGGTGSSPSAPTSVNLPETGQTTCYDAAGNVIACANTGQDGELQRGVAWPSQRFTVDSTGFCITDNLTGLMWVRNANSGIATWQNALAYANGLSICGYADWRLPNKKELRSLIHYEQANSATWLNGQGFSNVQANSYWSSTTHSFATTSAWFVTMSGGDVSSFSKSGTLSVWPVRAGQ